MSDRRRPSRSTALLAAALLALLAPPSRGESEECIHWCREGVKHLNAHEYEEARDCYAKARETDPQSGVAQDGYASCLSYLASTTNEQNVTWDQVIAEWEKVLKLDCRPSDKSRSCRKLGDCYANIKKDIDTAVKWYRKGVAIDPKCGILWLKLAERYYRDKQYEESLDRAQKALDAGTLDESETVTAQEYVRDSKAALTDPGFKKPVFHAVFSLPSLGGLVTTPDLATLVVSVPSAAQLIYYDTAASQEAKKVSLDFQPGRLAVQGKTLFAAAHGTAKLYALDLESGKVSKTIKLPAALLELCCNRSKGLLYGTTAAGEVLSIDPASGKVTTCQARGTLVAIDPSKPGAVYVLAAASPAKPEGKAVLRKYTVTGGDLKLVDTNDGAALGVRGLEVSPDGKRVAVVGEGGFEDKADGAKAGTIAVFETEKVTTTAGQLDAQGSPRCLAFHPFLEIGVALTQKGIIQFNARSFVRQHDWPSPASESKEPFLAAFVDGGKKVACWDPGDASKNVEGKLGLVSLVLTDEDSVALQKALAASKGK